MLSVWEHNIWSTNWDYYRAGRYVWTNYPECNGKRQGAWENVLKDRKTEWRCGKKVKETSKNIKKVNKKVVKWRW